MINVVLHIEFLLLRHDCVILPGIGAFIRTYRSAAFNNGRITPPFNEVCFNSSITNNDGLIANSVARRENVSFEKASELVAEEVEILKSSLYQERELGLGKLGMLYLGENDNISFRPKSSADKINNFNGWTIIDNNSISAVTNPSADANLKSDNSNAHKNKSDSNYYIAINKKLVRYAAVLIFVFLGAYSLSLPGNGGMSVKVDKASVIPVGKDSDSNIPKEEKHIPAQQSIIGAEEVANTVSDTNESDKYFLIVATFSSNADCEKFIKGIESDEYSLKIVSTPSMSRVYAASSNSKEDLVKVLNSTSFGETFASGGWVWERK